jgi:Flp pilus assembly protein TadG
MCGRSRRFPALRAFLPDDRGQVAILFALAGFSILIGVASAIDLMRAYQTRQKLSQTAVMACQYATRSSMLSTLSASGASTYNGKVNSFITNTLSAQRINGALTNASPFAYTGGGAVDLTLTANVKTTFLGILKIVQMPVSATSHCFDTIASINQPPMPTAATISETFAVTGCTGSSACGYMYSAPGTKVAIPGGSWGYTKTSPTTTSSSTIGYTGSLQWVVLGHCLEVDTGIYANAVPAGSSYHSVELDCDNASNTAGNSSISTKQSLASGNYELRYYYNSRVKYPNYDPTYICGSTAADVSWATSTNSTYISNSSTTLSSGKLRTDQINVYLDADSNGTPPLHQTIDGTQNLGGSNLIDMCVYSGNFDWIERSLRIYVNSPGNYWLSFAADGASDSYGGALAYIRLCPGTCSGTLLDNFPSTWTSSSILFEDNFDSPTSYSYTTSGSNAYVNTTGNMTSSTGTSGASSGWPNLAASGWAAAPTNQINYVKKTAAAGSQGAQAIELDGSGTTRKRLVSRGFLLDPGYYKLSYYYVSDGQFASLSGVYCGATPSAANVTALTGTATAVSRPTGLSASVDKSSNIVGVFMSHAQKASTPTVGGSAGAAASYTNPDGTTSATATVAPDAISLTSYDSTQVNPLLDICGYASSWQARSVNILIVKPAYYWLTIAALGAAITQKYGGVVDDVKLTPLGSPYMSSPPSSYVSIPTPGAQPSSVTSFSGFDLVNDPIAAPAPLQ